MSTDTRLALRDQMRLDELVGEFRGVFGRETIEGVADDSLTTLMEPATVYTYVPLIATRFARERLRALAQAEGTIEKTQPEVLFVCTHNAGRSQMAARFTTEMSGGWVAVRSAGSQPAGEVNPVVDEAMAELGLHLGDAFPKPLTDEVVRAADVVITMGCGDACPLYPGTRYLDWDVEDPAGRAIEDVRRIRDDVRRRVAELLRELGVPPA